MAAQQHIHETTAAYSSGTHMAAAFRAASGLAGMDIAPNDQVRASNIPHT